MTNFLSIPDKERNYQSYMVYVLAIIWSIVTIAVVSMGFYFFPDLWVRWLAFVGISLFIVVFNLSLNRLGHIRAASWSLTIMLWLLITIPCYSAGGITAPGILSQMSVILTAGILLGWRGGLAIGLLTMGTDFGLAYIEMTGHLPVPSVIHTPMTRWLGAIIPFGTILALQYYATNHLRSGLVAMQREILKQEEASESLRASEERYKSIIAVSNTGAWEYHLDTDRVWYSAQYFDMLGLDKPDGGWDNTMATTWIERLHPDDREASIKIFDNYLKNGSMELYENFFRMRHENGDWIWIWSRARRLRDKDGNLTGTTLGTHTDITERKKATELFRQQFENSPDIIVIINHDLKIESINRGRPNSGLTPAEYIGIDSIEVLPEESRENAREAATRCFATGENIEIENEIIGNRWMRSRFVPIRIDGHITSIMIIATDITKQRIAEQQLRQSEEKNRALIENIAEAIVLIDENENVLYQSPAVTRITGYLPEDSYGQRSFSFIHPDETQEFRFLLQQAINTPEERFQAQFRIIHKNGDTIWMEGTLVNMLHNESIKGIVINYRDVTERKESEEKVKESEQLLKKITSQVPGNTYMFEIDETGAAQTLFFNRGTDDINHSLDLQDAHSASPKLLEALHDDDKLLWTSEMKKAYDSQSPISFQYRLWLNGQLRWRWFRAIPEKTKDGRVLWYGAAQDITPLVDYIASIEQIIFDISHVIRRPISSLMGMTKPIIDNDLSEKEIREISKKLYLTSEEMDKFIRELTLVYNQKRQNTKLKIDISSLIDKRGSLFE